MQSRDVNFSVGSSVGKERNGIGTEWNGMELERNGTEFWNELARSTGSFTGSTSSFIVQVGSFRSFHVPFQPNQLKWNGMTRWNVECGMGR